MVKVGKKKEGNHHCWLPKNISEIFDFIKREKTINGKFTKKYSLEEKKKEIIEPTLWMVCGQLKAIENIYK